MKKLNELKGRIMVTREVSDTMLANEKFAEEVATCLKKHFNNDFGNIDKDDIEENINALKNDLKTDRVLSRYETSEDDIYIISELYGIPEDTQIDYSLITTVMFIYEY